MKHKTNQLILLFQIWIVCDSVYAQLQDIKECRFKILNTASEMVKLEYKPIQDQLLIQQHSSLTEIQRRPTTEG